MDSCRLFAKYVLKHNCIIPQWEVAAFWFLGAIASGKHHSVGRLTKAIDDWYEALCHAIWWWDIHKNDKPSKDQREMLLNELFAEDLIYAGVLNKRTLQLMVELSLEQREDIFWKSMHTGGDNFSYLLPSAVRCGVVAYESVANTQRQIEDQDIDELY